jgi:hypothetical protein
MSTQMVLALITEIYIDLTQRDGDLLTNTNTPLNNGMTPMAQLVLSLMTHGM